VQRSKARRIAGIYPPHCFLRDLPANVSQKFPKNWRSSAHLTTAGIAYDFVRTASASSRDSFVTSNGPTGRDLFAYACARLWFLARSEEHTSELQSLAYLVCRLLLEKKKT